MRALPLSAMLLPLITSFPSGCDGSGEVLESAEYRALPSAGSVVRLVNVSSNKCVDLENGSPDDGANIRQWPCNGATAQEFVLDPAADGYVLLRNVASNKCLDVWGWSTSPGANIAQWACHGGTNQQFMLEETSNGIATIRSRLSNLVLDVEGGSAADGANIMQWNAHGGANQRFEVISAGGGGDGGGDGGGPDPSCGDPNDFDAWVHLEGGTWIAENGGSTVYTGGDMMHAMQAGLDSLTPGRSSKESVLVCGSGTIGPHAGSIKRVRLPSYSILDVRGTMTIADTGEGDIVPVACRNASHVEVPNLRIEGNPRYSVWVQSCSDVELGDIDISLSNILTIGHGIRIDDSLGSMSTDVSIDHVQVEGTGTHGVETYGVDDLTIGHVEAVDTGGCGLLLNATTHADIGVVDAVGAGSGTGYAAFRIANGAGRIGGQYPTNIHVGEVNAQGGGRGVFCVSDSGGLEIDHVDISQTETNAILLENCHNVSLATGGGTVSGGGNIRIAARADMAPSSDITLENLTVVNNGILESPCSGTNNVASNITLVGSSLQMCN